MKFMYFIEKKTSFIYNHLFCCNPTYYYFGMFSVASTLRYVTSASRFQSRSSVYIRGLIPRNLSVPIVCVVLVDGTATGRLGAFWLSSLPVDENIEKS